MKKRLISILMICGILISLLVSASPVKAEDTFPSPDSDGDGISDAMETAGWYINNYGPYQTDPFNADSDSDGLTDGEEKLFNTSPLDNRSPGIGVKYDPSFQTIEYFSTSDGRYQTSIRGGDQFLMRYSMVIRRGTTFNLIGPNTATLEITGTGLTPLTGIPDPVNGGWAVTVPTDGTVGTYTATFTLGTWTKSMPIYVIFELPTDLPENQVDAFVYDDDPANLRDEVSVWMKAPESQYLDPVCPDPEDPDAPCSAWEFHNAMGYTQAFWTEQFRNSNFLTHTMPAIQGATTIDQAAQAIGEWSNREFRVNYSNIVTSFSSAMARWDDGTGITMIGGGCESTAGVYTSMLRSAGIAARLYTVDYSKTIGHGEPDWLVGTAEEYDNSPMFWSDGQWKSIRNYTAEEDAYYPFDDNGGITALFTFENILGGANWYYNDQYGDLLVSVGPDWDFQDGSNGGGMVNTVWSSGVPSAEWNPINRDYMWDSKTPLEIVQSPNIQIFNCQIWEGDNWRPSEWRIPPVSNPTGRDASQTYFLPEGIPDPVHPLENWPYNPQPIACSASTSPEDCAAFQASWSTICPSLEQTLSINLQSDDFEDTSNSDDYQDMDIEIGNILESEGFDKDGDGRYDELRVKFEVTSSSTGEVNLGGIIQIGENAFRAIPSNLILESGKQVVQISFDGEKIGDIGLDGPYQIAALWVASPEEPVLTIIDPEMLLDYKTFTYNTLAFAANDFEVTEAVFSDDYSFEGIDGNGNDLFEAININIGLDIAIAQTFQVSGVLRDSQGNYVGDAAWTGTGNVASLIFNVTDFQPPFTLENLNLTLQNGQLLDYRTYKVFEITGLEGDIETSDVQIETPEPAEANTRDVTTIDSWEVVPTDTNGNGRFDKLVINVDVTVTGSAGTYRIEGLLEDAYGTEIAWSVSDPQALSLGSQTMALEFDGKMIYDQLPLTGSRALKLVALKIYSGNFPASTTLQAQLPVVLTTSPYTRSLFEPSSDAIPLFEDDIENGSTKWNATGTLFNLTASEWHSWSNSWFADTSLTADATLALATPLDLTEYASPWIKFTIAYRTASPDDFVDLEASTDGTTWTTLATYTGTTTYWTTQKVDLTSLGKNNSVSLRFNAHSQSGLLFYLDDVYISAWPAVSTAMFTYAPDTIIATETETTFSASYTSIAPTLPVTYDWDFCGVVLEDSSPEINYTFPFAGDCEVTLTVTNPYDSTVASEVIYVVPTGEMYTLETNIAGDIGGSVLRDPDRPGYNPGETVTLTAVAEPGYTFSEWSGDLIGSTNPATVTMNSDTSITASFTQDEYTMTLIPAGNGSFVKDPDQVSYHYGDTVQLTANPDVEWSFLEWSGDLTGNTNPVTIIINGDTTITGTFVIGVHQLLLDTNGEGSITADPDQPFYPNDMPVQLSAVPALGWSFSSWSGDLSGSENPVSLTMNGDKSVTANFTQNQYNLTVDIVGDGSIIKLPDSTTYVYGETVELTAVPDFGWHFVEWSGDISGSDNPVSIEMTGNKSVNAVFEQDLLTCETFETGFTIGQRIGSHADWYDGGSGPIITAGNGVANSVGLAPGTAIYNWTAHPFNWNASNFSKFVAQQDFMSNSSGQFDDDRLSWTTTAESTSSSNEFGVQLDSANGGIVTYWLNSSTRINDVIAELTGIKADTWYRFRVEITKLTPTSAMIDVSLVELDSNGDPTGTEIVGSIPDTSLLASGHTPNSTYFSATSMVPSYKNYSTTGHTTAPADNTCYQVETSGEPVYYLTTNVVGSGSITRLPDLTEYSSGTEVTLTPIPDEGWSFSNWSGACTGNGECVVTMLADETVTATFIRNVQPAGTCESFDSFTAGSTIGTYPDWYDGGAGPVVTSGIGLTSSIGLSPASNVFTWTAYPFNWNAEDFSSITFSMDYQTNSSGQFDDDRMGWIISDTSTSSADQFGVQLDSSDGGIVTYWRLEDGTTRIQTPIAEFTTLSSSTWYRLEATFTKLTPLSAKIDVVLTELDASGNPTGTPITGTLPDTSAWSDGVPAARYFTATSMWPSYKNHSGTTGAADNVCFDISTGKFAFIVTTDLHTSDSTPNTYIAAKFDRIADFINNPTSEMPAPEFMVITGDFPNLAQTEQIIDDELGSDFLWYPVIGNHEISDNIANFYAIRDTMVPSLPNIVDYGPVGSVNTTYSWDYENAHFIAINPFWDGASNDHTSGGDIPAALNSWVAEDLAANDEIHNFVFIHTPPFPSHRHIGEDLDANPTNRDAFISTLDTNNVESIFAGHTHYYEHDVSPEFALGDVNQITNGSLREGGVPITFTYVLVDGNVTIYKVFSWNGSDFTLYDEWTINSEVPDQPPAAPSDLSAEAISYSQIDLTWVDNADNESAFEIERSVSGGAYSLLTTVGADSEAFSDFGLTAETEYCYRVRATNAAGPSAYTEPVCDITPEEPPSSLICESYETGFTLGQIIGTHTDWLDGAGPVVNTGLGVNASNGLGTASSIYNWTAYPFNWNAEDLEKVILQQDFQASESGTFNDDRLSWTTNATSTESRYEFGVQLDNTENGGIVTYWSNTIGGSKLYDVITPLSGITANTWYRFRAEITKLTATSAQIDVTLTELDAEGNPTGTPITGSLADTSLLAAGHTPAAEYFSATSMVPSYKNYNSTAGHADNTCHQVVTNTQTEYALTITQATGGTITAAPDAPYYLNDEVTLTAAPSAGYNFTAWTGDCAGQGNPCTLTMDADKSVSATFTQIEYALTITQVTGGTITAAPDSPYYLNDEVTLTAAPTAGYNFTAWTGDCAGQGNPCTLTMDANKSVSATFTQNQPPAAPSDLSAEAISYSQIDLTWVDNADNESAFEIERSVSGGAYSLLTTVGADSEAFSDFGLTAETEYCYRVRATNAAGPSAYTEPVCDITPEEPPSSLICESYETGFTLGQIIGTHTDWLDGAGPVVNTGLGVNDSNGLGTASSIYNWTAYPFNWNATDLEKVILQQDFQASGSGTFNDDRLSWTTNATSTESRYEFGVQLDNTENGGIVTYWSNTIGGSKLYDVITPISGITANTWYRFRAEITKLTATSAQIDVTLTELDADGNPTGTPITGSLADTSLLAAGHTPAADYFSATSMVPSYKNYNSTAGHADNTCHQVVTNTQTEYALTITQATGGTITAAPDAPYYLNDEVTLTAAPSAGYNFTAWTGDCAGQGNPCTLTMDADKSVSASFTQIEYALTITQVTGGEITAAPVGPYHLNDEVILTATPAAGYDFTAWTGDCLGQGNPCTLTMDADKSVSATFTQIEYALIITQVTGGEITAAPDGPYHLNDEVILTATPTAGYNFTAWTGDCAGQGNPCTLTMDADKSVSATFTQIEYALTITQATGGTITAAPDGPYYLNDEVTLTAAPTAGYNFTAWTGDCAGQGNPCTLTMDAAKSVSASFTQIEYALTITQVTGGTITAAPDGPYHLNDEVILTATPAAGYSFSAWTGDCAGQGNPCILTMDADKSVSATFTQIEYALTITQVTGGTITVAPDGPYHLNDGVTLTATPASGYSFSAWTGDCAGQGNPCTLTMDADKSVSATFTQNEYALTITQVTGGTITAAPDGPYHLNDGVTLTATPAAGYSFSGWTGDCAGQGNPCILTMDAAKSVSGTFTQNEYILSIVSDHGTVGVVPDQATYTYGTDVVLTMEIVEMGWTFTGWSGGNCSGTLPCTVNITDDTTVTANFTQDEYSLNVGIVPVDSGNSVNLSNYGPYHYNDEVTIEAVTTPGWQFDHWLIGSTVVTESETIVTITDHLVVTAYFTEIEYALTITQVPGGTITAAPDGPYHLNDEATLTATPAAGYSFSAWTGDCAGQGNPCTLTMDADKSVSATFIQIEYALTITQVTGGTITAAPDGPYYLNAGVTLTATPAAGYSFSGWTGDCAGQGNPCILTMDAAKNVSGTFTQNEYALIITQVPGGTITVAPAGPYYLNDEVILTATPDEEYSFIGWTGDCAGQGNPCTLTMNAAKSVSAVFENSKVEYQIFLPIILH